jgi:prepilin-type processing-associated H-X9-DG protein
MSRRPVGTEDGNEHRRRGRPSTLWPGTTPGNSEKIGKGASQTAFLVEVANSGIHWMEPRDLEMSSFDPTINSTSGRSISSNHVGGANVAFADGSVRCLSPHTSPEVLKAMLTTDVSDDAR